MHTSTEIHCHYSKTRSPFRLPTLDNCKQKKMTYWKKKKKHCYSQGNKEIVFCLWPPENFMHNKTLLFILSFCLYHILSLAQRQLYFMITNIRDAVCVCVCGGVGVGVACWCLLCWCLKGIKQQVCSWLSLKVLISSLARLGSAIRSEATLAASRHTKKHAHT